MEAHWQEIAAFIGLVGGLAWALIQIGKIWKAVEDNTVTIVATVGKLDLLRSDVSDHKVDVARNYATNADLQEAINRLDNTLRQYLDAMQRSR